MDLLTVDSLDVILPSPGQKNITKLYSSEESSTLHISEELVKAHTYFDQKTSPAEFAKIDPPLENPWISSVKNIPIAHDKFCNNAKDLSFYRKDDELIQITKIRNCEIIFFIKGDLIEGSLILTRRDQNKIELEYGKNKEIEKNSLSIHMISTVLDNYVNFGLQGSKEQLYAEVIPLDGKDFNFPSYITLMRAKFSPIERVTGDGIRFVFKENERNVISSIVSAYNNYEKSSKELLNNKTPGIKSAVADVLGTTEKTEGKPIKELQINKDLMAKQFEEAIRSVNPK